MSAEKDVAGSEAPGEAPLEIPVTSDEDEPQPVEWKPGRQQWLIFICLSLLASVVSLDMTIVSPAIPVIEESLGGSTVEAFWAGTSYLLANAVCQPLIVDLSDVFGRRLILFIAVALFTLGTILCAVAHSFALLLSGRSIQGVGGGGIMAECLVIVTDIVPLRQRPSYYAIIQASWALGTLAGPLIGGAIAENTTWRWIFYINLPFCGVGIVLVPLTVRLTAERPSIKERLAIVDWIGGVLFIGSFCSLLIGITWGGNQFPWSSWRTYVPILVGAVGVIGSLFWEGYAAKRPFVPMYMFKSFPAVMGYFCTLLQGFLLLGLMYFIPVFMQASKGMNAIEDGLSLMIILGILLPSSIIAGVLFTRLGHFRWAIWSGWSLSTLGIGLMVLMDQWMPARHWAFIFVTIGLGNGLVLTALNFAVQAHATDHREGTAAGLYTFSRSLGACLGVAFGQTFFQNRLQARFSERQLPEHIAKAAPEFALKLRQPGWDPAQKEQFVLAFVRGFKDLWWFFMAVSALALLLSLGIRHATLNRELKSDHALKERPPETEDAAVKM